MAGRYYDGQYRAQGETAHHSGRTECHNRILKYRKKIRKWVAFANRTPGEKAQAEADRRIAAIEFFIAVEERCAAELDQQIADYESRTARRKEAA